jgi:hypothetical protein
MSDEIKDLMKIDPLLEAERITGKSYKEDEETSRLGLAISMEMNHKLNKLLEESRDTTFCMDYEPYLEAVERLGFREIRRQEFSRYSEYDGETKDEFRLYYRDGWLISVDSFRGKRNTANLFGIAYGPWDGMRGGNSSPVPEIEVEEENLACREVSFDVREGLFLRWKDLMGANIIALPWPKIGVEARLLLSKEEWYTISPKELYEKPSSFNYLLRGEELDQKILSVMSTFPQEVRAYIEPGYNEGGMN